MPPPNWDDEFDFDDIDDIPKNKKINNKKSKPNEEDEFFEDDAASNKLPAIGTRNPSGKAKPISRGAPAKKNPYAENMDLRGDINIYDDVDEEFQEQILDEPPKNSKALSSTHIKKNASQVPDELDFDEQEIEEIPKKTSTKKMTVEPARKTTIEPVKKTTVQPVKKKEEPPQDEYKQEFDEDYGDDFQELPSEPIINKVQTPVIKTEPPQHKKSVLNVNLQPPKPPSRKQQNNSSKQIPKRNQTLAAKDRNVAIPRVPSRQSIKSVSSNKVDRNKSVANRSRVSTNKFTTNTSFLPNKYANQMQRQFPNVNLNEMNQEKLSKLNDKIRAMIKKFNEELNDLINKNMLLLKNKKKQKSSTVEDKIRVLEEQKKNNQTMIEYMDKEYQKLTGREGELREEEYQLMTEKKIEQSKEKIKETARLITKLKYQVKNEGNKLSRNSQDKKIAQQLHHLKTNLIQSKKDEEKQIEKIDKLEEQSGNLNEKISDIEYQITELIDQAKEKGIKLESKDQLIKKFEETRKKLQANRNHRTTLEHLLKSKSEIILHEKQQLRIGIKNYDMEIKNLYGSIEHTHVESVKVVEKAKANPKVGENLATELEAILRSLEVVIPDNYSVRSESNKSRSSHRPLKNSELENIQKSQPLRSDPSINIQKNKDSHDQQGESSSKPNLLKKKFKIGGDRGNDFTSAAIVQEEKKNEVYERVWKEEEDETKNRKIQQEQKEAALRQQEVAKQQEEDKKKPFSLKKNRLSADKQNPNNISIGDETDNNIKYEGLKINSEKEEQKKEEQKPSLAGPRMMKFKKRANNDDSATNITNPNDQQQSKALDSPPENNNRVEEQEQHKPAFVPKRFNMRKRQQKKDDEPAYMPTIQQKKQEPKKLSPKKQQESVYKPKFDFGGAEDPYAKKPTENAYDPFAKKPTENAYDPFSKKQEPVFKSKEKIIIPSLEEEQAASKPRFNLRLRDRKKNEEDNDGGYLPAAEKKNENPYAPKNVQKKEEKPIQNPYNPYAPKQQKQAVNNPYAPSNNVKKEEEPINNPYNPYAPSNNVKKEEEPINNPYNPYVQQQDAPARKKQGPIKKPKMQPAGQKQKINIYEQAEEPEGINQFTKEQSPPKNTPVNPYAEDNKELDLNDILGLNKKKNKGNDDFSDLIGGGGVKDRKAKKKNDDFFGDMDL